MQVTRSRVLANPRILVKCVLRCTREQHKCNTRVCVNFEVTLHLSSTVASYVRMNVATVFELFSNGKYIFYIFNIPMHVYSLNTCM